MFEMIDLTKQRSVMGSQAAQWVRTNIADVEERVLQKLQAIASIGKRQFTDIMLQSSVLGVGYDAV